MTKLEKINVIANNLDKFSAFDKKNRARLCSNVNKEKYKECNNNIYIFHIADRLGVFSKNTFSMTQKTREMAVELGLLK